MAYFQKSYTVHIRQTAEVYISIKTFTPIFLASSSLLEDVLFVRASPMAQQVKNPCAIQETQVRFLGQEDTLEKEMATERVNLGRLIRSPSLKLL